MTDTTTPTQGKTGGMAPLVLITIGVLLLIGLFVLGRSEVPLERSVTGFKGMAGWLRENDQRVLVFGGGAALQKSEFGLRILPLYDTDLSREREVPEDRESLIAQTSENDVSGSIVRRKLKRLPTLVILPKWRTGVRALGVAHKDLLIPRQELNRLLGQLGVEGARLTRDAQGFTTQDVRLHDGRVQVGLLHAQTVTSTNCETMVSFRRQPLLLRCGEAAGDSDLDTKAGSDAVSPNAPDATAEAQFWILTDPDLASNHGLSLAQNGQAILSIITSMDVEGTMLLDLSDEIWVLEESAFAPAHERNWDDIARVFAWPFTMIWIAFFILAGLVIWRAVTRYGPPARPSIEEPLAAKTTSIAAKARLLRLADHDVALLQTHITARLHQLLAELLGPHRQATDNPMTALMPLVKRANPELAAELPIAAAPPQPGADLLAHLDRFENCYDRIRHEFGRPSNAG